MRELVWRKDGEGAGMRGFYVENIDSARTQYKAI